MYLACNRQPQKCPSLAFSTGLAQRVRVQGKRSAVTMLYKLCPCCAGYVIVANTVTLAPKRGLLTLGAHAHSEGYSSCRVCMCVCVYVCMCVCVYVWPLITAASHIGITKQRYQRVHSNTAIILNFADFPNGFDQCLVLLHPPNIPKRRTPTTCCYKISKNHCSFC